MDLNLTAEETQFRDEFRAWLEANLPKEPLERNGRKTSPDYWKSLREWQCKLFAGGWAGVSWPKEYGGRGATPIEESIYLEELVAAKAPERVGVIGEGLVGPTIIASGTKGQKEKFLPRILDGTHIWCQGFSEPNAGSDVGSLATKAVREGDEFLVNGQKIWTSFAQIADWCLLLVRTDFEAPKHKGISCLLVDMKSDGVSVRPLRQMSGEAGFNEVFFTNVRVPADHLLGELNEGWKITITALMHERVSLGSGLYVMFKAALNELIQQAKSLTQDGETLAKNPIHRQKIAQAYLELEIFRLNSNRALSEITNNVPPGPEGSILKLFWSEMNQRQAQTAMEVLGDRAQLEEFDGGKWIYRYLRSRGNTIEAGTSEIQRNILAQRVLGLPRGY
ncbi:MAG: putative acyl-CoA dehydrogenase FadE17 [Verrucomicrobia subdivision 3 bacterium]|nr:putative acyl-CoA dehydrogenase FadE17 [Limisphaerales bacterium]MCS1413907.1 putative acyl-CoA dehydrogenase FadE17 [Limisphaerales bacterium]